MSTKPSFFAELKRRNVYKVAIAYAVIAWLLIQAASIFLPAFNAPQWAMQIVILLLVVGFPIALAFSWAFEITPEGIVRESEVQADESITHHTGRKIVALTIVLAVIATGLLIFQFVRARSTSSVRFKPSGVSSNAHAITSAIGNPITIASTTRRTAQFGISKNGKTCVATCTSSHPTIAYATATL